MTSPTSGPIHPTIECAHCKAKVMLSVYVWSDVKIIMTGLGWERDARKWVCPDCKEYNEQQKEALEEILNNVHRQAILLDDGLMGGAVLPMDDTPRIVGEGK